MKVAVTFLIVFILSIFIVTGLIYSQRYSSAFEADQQCHFDMKMNYPPEVIVDCDHDLETRQWLLFQKSIETSPAKVLKRYKY